LSIIIIILLLYNIHTQWWVPTLFQQNKKKTFDTVKLSICFHKIIHDGSIISIYNRPTSMLGEMFIIISLKTLWGYFNCYCFYVPFREINSCEYIYDLCIQYAYVQRLYSIYNQLLFIYIDSSWKCKVVNIIDLTSFQND